VTDSLPLPSRFRLAKNAMAVLLDDVEERSGIDPEHSFSSRRHGMDHASRI
jgi:hypothetical protein